MADLGLSDFLRNFALPFVGGGEVHIGPPLPAATIAKFSVELDDHADLVIAIDEARQKALAPLIARPPAVMLEGEDLSLLAAVHNALFLAHPKAAGLWVTDKARRRVIDASMSLASVPLTTEHRRVLGRHGLLHQFFRLFREDISLSWWTGSARFVGQTPPPRLTAWSGIRRVHRDVTAARFADILATPQAAPIVATIARRTPLTQLLEFAPGAPPLHWEDAVFLLRDPEMARIIAYALAAPEASHGGVFGFQLLWRAAAAFEQMIERSPRQADIRAVAALFVFIEGLICLDEVTLRGGKDKSALIAAALATGSDGNRERGAATFFTLANALALIDPRIAAPPWLQEHPKALERWEVHRTQVVAILGAGAVEALASRLRRHIDSDFTNAVAAQPAVA